MILALYLFSLGKTKFIYFGFLAWTISMLFHYDGAFIFPFAAYLMIKTKKFKHILLAGGLAAILLGIFYIPFVTTLSPATLAYWRGRLAGGSTKISSSKYLFSVYQPIYVLKIYFILGALGVVSWFKKIDRTKLALLAWILFPSALLETLVNIPGTHIYTYLVPSFVVVGYGVALIEKLKPRLLILAGIATVFLFIFLQSNTIYVEHKLEYPWEDEKFLIWTLPKPSSVYHLSLFGFPYNRNWDGIRNHIIAENKSQNYSSNERKSITRYYIKSARANEQDFYYVYIIFPQSFEDRINNARAFNWAKRNKPIKHFYVDGRLVSYLYLIPATFETNGVVLPDQD